MMKVRSPSSSTSATTIPVSPSADGACASVMPSTAIAARASSPKPPPPCRPA
ncbi:hypothetical protein C791_0841 [Amycolatopsis azurea DSM 43854]|uniref:Uncharacterized protein n=1 Tax=Amycolatopsis azurea DSM 43854 TaxID=1238180 RepID=M2PBU8_9PSEU|nr:hypothetical protein C791_0841 [Amycolatopsis azurea DSM 43854]